MKALVPIEVIEGKILSLRGYKVMLDRDLAELYGVETRILNQAVRRNMERFPDDFMFSLTREVDCTPAVRQCGLEQSGRGFGFS
jgi:hypothetical protein